MYRLVYRNMGNVSVSSAAATGLYDSALDLENGYKLVMPSPTMMVHRRIILVKRRRLEYRIEVDRRHSKIPEIAEFLEDSLQVPPVPPLLRPVIKPLPARLLPQGLRGGAGLGRLEAEPEQRLLELLERAGQRRPLRRGGAGHRRELLLQLDDEPLRGLLADAGDLREPGDVGLRDRPREVLRLDPGEDVLRGARPDALHLDRVFRDTDRRFWDLWRAAGGNVEDVCLIPMPNSWWEGYEPFKIEPISALVLHHTAQDTDEECIALFQKPEGQPLLSFSES